MDDYSVSVDTLAPEPGGPDIDDALDRLMDLLAVHHGVVQGDGRGWGATVSVDAADVGTAYAEGIRIVVEKARRAGLPDWPVVDVHVIRGDVLEAEIHDQHPHDVFSGPGAAEFLGITRQRLHQLRREREDFPAPLYEFGSGPLWARSDIEDFAKRYQPRRPQRQSA